MSKITQKDIAEALGVSISLVSRVLSGQGEKVGISKERIRAVLDFARSKHYVPQSAALALKGKKTKTLGLVVYDFHDPFFARLIAEFQRMAHAMGYSLLLVGFLNRVPDPSDLDPLYKHFVDGIIILGSYGDLDWVENFGDVPVCRVGQGDDPRISFRVSVDELDAARKIVRHLKSIGRRNLFYVSRKTLVHKARFEANLSVAEEEGCSMKFLGERDFPGDFEAGCAAADMALLEGGVDAFVCSTDIVATGVIKRLHEIGKSVPNDYSVVGFDDISFATNYIPSITSFRQPVESFASLAMNFIAKGETKGSFIRRGELIVRESSMPLA